MKCVFKLAYFTILAFEQVLILIHPATKVFEILGAKLINGNEGQEDDIFPQPLSPWC